MDLSRYGIRLVLRKGMVLDDTLELSRLAQGSFSRSQGRFDLHSGTYSLGAELGSGTYGTTYQAIHSQTNHVFAIKVTHVKTVDHVSNAIKECVINILLDKESENEPEGPYVPRFYEMAYDPLRKLMIIRTERLHGVVKGLYEASTPEQNDAIVPETLGNIAHILNFFYKPLRFNHRDLKSDNVGYMVNSSGKHSIKLIDFGFACITWNGIQISGASYFPATDPCYIPSRDLMQIVYELLTYDRHLFSLRLQKFLEDVLTFPLDNKICKLFQGCSYGSKHQAAKQWDTIYDFLNNKRVHNPRTEPQELYKRMLEFLGEAPAKQTTLVDTQRTGKIKHCLPEQILNPKTRRCVRRSGKVGRRIQKESNRRTPSPTIRQTLRKCKPGQMLNPVTRRCRQVCPPSFLRNPATQRCVSRHGAIGRKLIAEGVRTRLENDNSI